MEPTLVSKPLTVEGVLFDELYTPAERLNAAIGFEDIRDDDIFVCTYPKAGTHWAADIANKIAHDGDIEKADSVRLDTAYLEMAPEQKSPEREQPAGTELKFIGLQELSELPSPRVLLTHLPCHLLPEKVRMGKAKVIYVHRDPRDMAVSLWHSMKPAGDPVTGEELTWPRVFDCFLNGNVAYGSWADHFKSCQQLKSRRPVLTLHYECMLKDLTGTVKQVAAHLGKELSDCAVRAVAESCSFAASKRARPESPFLRKGVAGSWLATFTVAQSELFDIKLDSEIARLDLDVRYWPHSKIPVKNDIYSNMYKYQGVNFTERPVQFSRLRDVYGYADIRDDDVFVWTYPKAGTHWASDIAHKVVHDGDLQKVKSAGIELGTLEITSPGQARHLSLAELSTEESPRVILTHLHYRMLPELLQQGKGRLIYVFRDPRDIAVSMYNMHGQWRKTDPNWSWENFLKLYNTGLVPWGSWWEHFRDGELNGQRPNVLVLSYSEMKQDLLGNVRKIATFLGKALSEDTIKKIADSCTIEATKADKPNSPFVHKGTTGEWKSYFTVHQSEQFDKQVSELQERLGVSMHQ